MFGIFEGVKDVCQSFESSGQMWIKSYVTRVKLGLRNSGMVPNSEFSKTRFLGKYTNKVAIMFYNKILIIKEHKNLV